MAESDATPPAGRTRLLCLGEPMVEFNQTSDPDHYLFGHGGDTSNCAIAAARAGANVAYFTALGQDPFGDSLMQLWAHNGVDASHVLRDANAPTGAYFVHHGPEGHSFSYLRANSAASLLGPADMPRDLISGSGIIHLSGISMAISVSACDAVFEAMAVARAAGVSVSFDVNLRLKLWPLPRARALVRHAVEQSDILFAGLDEARLLTGLETEQSILDHYLAAGAKIVALTMGGRGCIVANAAQRESIAGCALECVDATAAGDTFDGNFLADYMKHGDPFRAALFANAAAALSTSGYGAVAPMPTRAQVESFMSSSE